MRTYTFIWCLCASNQLGANMPQRSRPMARLLHKQMIDGGRKEIPEDGKAGILLIDFLSEASTILSVSSHKILHRLATMTVHTAARSIRTAIKVEYGAELI